MPLRSAACTKLLLLQAILTPAFTMATTQRPVTKVTIAHRQREGGGFIVRRPVGGEVDHVGGVFLMLDHMGPAKYGPGEAVGAPDHPHRGFSTVTMVLEGSMQHKDSAGNSGTLGPGWVQWMDAGRGVVHSEMPSDSILRDGGTIEGFQLWVNLPAKDKMTPPRYQDVPPEKIPEVAVPGAKHASSVVRVIAGESCGASAVIGTRTPIGYLDIRLGPGDTLTQPVARGHVAFAYVYRGKGLFGPPSEAVHASESALVQIGEGDVFTIAGAGADGVKCLLISGEPIREPIARYGPFVMNTRDEIQQAFDDFRSGRMGEIEGAEERYARTEAARSAQQKAGTWSKSEL